MVGKGGVFQFDSPKTGGVSYLKRKGSPIDDSSGCFSGPPEILVPLISSLAARNLRPAPSGLWGEKFSITAHRGWLGRWDEVVVMKLMEDGTEVLRTSYPVDAEDPQVKIWDLRSLVNDFADRVAVVLTGEARGLIGQSDLPSPGEKS